MIFGQASGPAGPIIVPVCLISTGTKEAGGPDAATGAVRSIYDIVLRHELVNRQSPYRFGQYIYVAGGYQEPNSILKCRVVSMKPNVNVHSAQYGHLLSVSRTSDGAMEAQTRICPPLQQRFDSFDQAKKIKFIEDVTKKEVNSKEAVYFAFPFAMDHPQFQYEIQTGVVDPAKDMYLGVGYEWFSVQHWISVKQNGLSATVMPLDAAFVMLGAINRGCMARPNSANDQEQFFHK